MTCSLMDGHLCSVIGYFTSVLMPKSEKGNSGPILFISVACKMREKLLLWFFFCGRLCADYLCWWCLLYGCLFCGFPPSCCLYCSIDNEYEMYGLKSLL